MKKLKNIIQAIQKNDFKYWVCQRKMLNNSIIELNIKMRKLCLIYIWEIFLVVFNYEENLIQITLSRNKFVEFINN